MLRVQKCAELVLWFDVGVRSEAAGFVETHASAQQPDGLSEEHILQVTLATRTKD
jgi:hypothetical protein